MIKYRNGMVQHQKIGIGGQWEQIIAPQQYIDRILGKIEEIRQAQGKANISFQRAQQIEREYLHMACNGKHSIKGLDEVTARRICTWRDQFKEPYQQSMTKYTQQLELQRLQAVAQEQQLAQQSVYQQQAAQQQQTQQQQNAQALNSALQNVSKQLQQQTQNLLQQSQQYTAPSVYSPQLSRPNIKNCYTISNIEYCN